MESPELLPVLNLAADEAAALGHDFLGAEHLLIAASRSASPARVAVLTRYGLSPEALRSAVDGIYGPMQPIPGAAARPEPSVRARRALKRAAEQAAARGVTPCTVDDLLLGLLADDVAPGAVIGAVLERHQAAVLTLREELRAAGDLPS